MKLYMFQVAPNPTKVRLYIAEKMAAQAPLNIEQISVNLPKGEHRQAEHLARNANAKLPVLELDDGSFLTESLAIIEYLEECYPQPPMIGSTARERASVREVERIIETRILNPIARLIHATRSPTGHPPSEDIAERSRKELPAGLQQINQWLSDGRSFVCGQRVTIADCSLQAALQFARFSKLDLISEYQDLLRWDQSYRKRSAAQSVLVR